MKLDVTESDVDLGHEPIDQIRDAAKNVGVTLLRRLPKPPAETPPEASV